MANGNSDSKAAPLDLLKDDQRYQQLRRALVMFCRSNGSTQPEDDASETIARLYAKNAEGVSIDSLIAYAIGIARNVLHENQRKRKKEAEWRPAPADASAPEAVLRCLENCQRKCLSAQERRLIKAYYDSDAGHQIVSRAKLAKKLGITTDLLKLWAHRIRKKMESCVMKCRNNEHSDETD